MAEAPSAEAPRPETPGDGEPLRLAALDPVSVSNVFDVIYSTGTPDVIARYLAQGGDPNAETRSGFSLLSAAVSMGNAAIAEQLMGAGANLNRRAGNGETPLTSAIRSIRKDRILEMVELLLESGADPNLGIEGSPPLYLAVTLIKQDTATLARALLDAGANVNGQASGGITTLEIAVQTCFLESSKQANRETILTLLNYGARITNNTASLLYRYADIGVCQSIYDLFDARGIRLN
jgi:ankyrin repeat protein